MAALLLQIALIISALLLTTFSDELYLLAFISPSRISIIEGSRYFAMSASSKNIYLKYIENYSKVIFTTFLAQENQHFDDGFFLFNISFKWCIAQDFLKTLQNHKLNTFIKTNRLPLQQEHFLEMT